MPRNYRPRPYQDRSCQHCGLVFQTNHSRTKYCGDSCRVKAFYARQDGQEPRSHQAGNLSLTLQNFALMTAAASVPTVVNYAFNDYPSQKKIIGLLEAIKKGQTTVKFTNTMLAGMDYIVDYIGAQVAADVTLGPRIILARQERLNKTPQTIRLTSSAEARELLGPEASKLLGYE